MARHIGESTETVANHIRLLEDWQLIEHVRVEQRGQRRSNIYRIASAAQPALDDAERIALQPLQRHVTYRSCTPHQVVRRWRKRHRRRVMSPAPPPGGDAQLTLPLHTRARSAAFPSIVVGDVVLVADADRAYAALVDAREGDHLHLRSCQNGRALGVRTIDAVIGHYATPRRRGRRAVTATAPQMGLH